MEKSNNQFKDVLKKAQKLGYAEPGNPKLDLNGYDAFAKVRILSALAFNNKISKKKCLMEGIENISLKDVEISNKLNFLITGEKPTKRKIDNAKKYKVKIIDQNEFLKMLNKTS